MPKRLVITEMQLRAPWKFWCNGYELHCVDYVLKPHTVSTCMSIRFKKCMSKGGRESPRPSYGRPKLTLISREKKHLRRCNICSYGHDFQNSAQPLNQRYFDMYEIPLSQWLMNVWQNLMRAKRTHYERRY